MNGVCEGPWECNCNPGWSGKLCDKKGYETTTAHAAFEFNPFHDELLKGQGKPETLFKEFTPTKKIKRDDDLKDAPGNETNYNPSFEDVLPGFRTGEETTADNIETAFIEPPAT